MHNVTPEDLAWATAQTEEVLDSATRAPGKAREILAEKFIALRHQFETNSRSRKGTVPVGAHFWAHLLAAIARPTAEGARQKIFGNPAPPFTKYDNALAWLEHQRGSSSMTEATTSLRYWDADDMQETMPAASPQLASLAEAAGLVTFYTGWPQEASLEYIVCGNIPVGPAKPKIDFMAAPKNLQEMGVEWLRATVEISPWHLASNLREIIHPPLGHRLTTRDLMLLDLVAILGEAPPAKSVRGKQTGRKSYWTRIVKAWQKRYGEKVAWETVRMQWERLESRFPRVIKLLQEEGVGPRIMGGGK